MIEGGLVEVAEQRAAAESKRGPVAPERVVGEQVDAVQVPDAAPVAQHRRKEHQQAEERVGDVLTAGQHSETDGRRHLISITMATTTLIAALQLPGTRLYRMQRCATQ